MPRYELPDDWMDILAALPDKSTGCETLASALGMPYYNLLMMRRENADLNALCKEKMLGSGTQPSCRRPLPDDWRDILSTVPRGSLMVQYAAALDVPEAKLYELRHKHPRLDQYVREQRHGD